MADSNINIVVKAKDEASAKLKSIGTNIQEGLAKAATVAAVAGTALAAFGANAVKGAADAEQLKIAFTVMTGSAETAQKTLASLAEFAKTTPFDPPEVNKAAKSLLAFGVAAEDLEPTLRSLGDVSAGIGAPIGEISELFGKAKVQGRLFMEDINQLTGRGIPVIQEFAKQFGVTEGEVRGLVESGKIGFPELEKAFQSMSGEGGQFKGMMEALSQSFGGQLSALQGDFNALIVEIGTAMLPTLKQVATALQGVVTWFQNLSPETKTMIANAVLVAGAVAGVVVVLGTLGAAFPAVITGVTGLAGAFVFLATNPIGLMISTIAALTAGIVYLWNTNEGFRNAVITIWQAIQSTIGPIIAAIASNIAEKLNFIQSVWNVVWPALSSSVSTVWNAISGFVGGGIELISGLISSGMGGVEATWNGFWNGMKATVEGIVSALLGIVSGLMEKVNAAINAVKGAVGGVAGAANSFGSNFDLKRYFKAEGGPVSRNSPYVVGEQGPELFVPGSSGRIIPNNELSFGGGGSGAAVQVVISNNTLLDSNAAVRIGDMIVNKLRLNRKL